MKKSGSLLNYKEVYNYITFLKLEGWIYDRIAKQVYLQFEYDDKRHTFLDKRTDDFLYELGTLNHVPLTTNEVSAIKILILYRKNKILSQLLYEDDNWKTLRDIRRGTLRNRIRYLNRHVKI